jgi:hypothetical protein
MKSSDYRLFKKISEARRAKIDEWRRTYVVRWSETIERNEAYEAFSTACNFCLRTTDKGTESRRRQQKLFAADLLMSRFDHPYEFRRESSRLRTQPARFDVDHQQKPTELIRITRTAREAVRFFAALKKGLRILSLWDDSEAK